MEQKKDKHPHVIITDRGDNWEQLRYQINVEGMDWEDAEDTLEWAVDRATGFDPAKITIYLDPFFTRQS